MQRMIDFHGVTKKNINKHNTNCRKFLIAHREYEYLEVLDLEKQIRYLNLSYKPDIDKVYLFAKDPYEANDQLLIKKQ